MEILLRRFPHANLPPESLEDFEQELHKVAQKFGHERMLATVERVKDFEIDDENGQERRRRFFPNPNELWGFVPPVISQDLPRGCEVCNWTAFEVFEKFGRRVARRCACFTDPSLRTPKPIRDEAWVEREQAHPEYEAARQKFLRTIREYRSGFDMGKELRKQKVERDEQYDRNREKVQNLRSQK